MHEYTPNKNKICKIKLKYYTINYTCIILFFYTVFTMEKPIIVPDQKNIKNIIQKIMTLTSWRNQLNKLDEINFDTTRLHLIRAMSELWIQINKEARIYFNIERITNMLQEINLQIKNKNNLKENSFFLAMSSDEKAENALKDVKNIVMAIVQTHEEEILLLIQNWALEYNWSVVKSKTNLLSNFEITKVNWVTTNEIKKFKPWDVVEFEAA